MSTELDEALARLESFKELADGWLGEGSVAIRPKAIEEAGVFLRVTGCTIPGIAPTGDGGVTFEFTTEGDDWVWMEFNGDQNEGSRHFVFSAVLLGVSYD